MPQTKFLTTPQLIKVCPLGKTQLQNLRDQGVFQEGLHWVRYPGQSGRKVLWNWTLIQDYLATGGGAAHDRACEIYLSSLPSNQRQPA